MQLKKRILEMFFKKDLDQIVNQIYNQFEDAYADKEYLVQEREKNYFIIKRIFEEHSDAKIIGMKKNNIGDELLVVETKDAIYLYGSRYPVHKPYLFFRVENINEIRIIDVCMLDNDIGNGSIAMEALLRIAKEINVRKISGTMSYVDDDHADRRNHYYEKFGFKISNGKAVLKL